ncbi:MAG: GntR family transcriptional regulator [Bacteroidales bacterium]|nr:GntR family transcriptional regulator [Bacteroidales bacterium]MDD6773130.1 GntR family transcriptional regulator [Bacteroidales bacterium]MDO4214257.1 GntR family transcriptional regulator [Bacteroidales bacterium]
MEFDSNKPIYIQIADNICEKILSGEMTPGSRIPSVREWGAKIGVNPNTVARSYEILTNKSVIYNQRGIGFFVSDNAISAIQESELDKFIKEEIPAFVNRAKLLGIDLKEYI